ncbi:hypothetical protein LEP1GSC008_0758 [Leptospira kirschneri serovar Bulgarica str. Nikolaevo]|uniref:Uncharacterized protein n=1 Tax=Leptospira kirschneri serovar Bulgarica str. Nikolaevo TaxID=1240687 RepID=M6FEN8_9LEPT|nr:hypothetical protein LEP1GSC008_0758 [Leptospira kirschneri serovar Bulgarica str. Nikolaevo]
MSVRKTDSFLFCEVSEKFSLENCNTPCFTKRISVVFLRNYLKILKGKTIIF